MRAVVLFTIIASSALSAQSPSRAAAANVVTITARDFAFDAPMQIPAGLTTLELINKGPEIHHAQLIRFTGKRSVKNFLAAMKAGGPPPAWAEMMGGPNAVDPGGNMRITQVLEPGNYGIVCFVDTPDHVPHIMKGMSKDLRVAPSKRTRAMPVGDVRMGLVDYNFALSKPLTAGFQRVTVTNDAKQPHEVYMARLVPGKTTPDLMSWLEKMAGPPPATSVGGVANLISGKSASWGLTLTPGEYVLICFAPDAKDGKPHFMHGMVQTVSVK